MTCTRTQDKYNLQQLGDAPSQQPQHEPPAPADEVSSNLKAALTQQHARQLQLKQQRIAAVKASAAAVKEWTQQQLDRRCSNTAAAAQHGSHAVPSTSKNGTLCAGITHHTHHTNQTAAGAAAAATGSVGVTSQQLQQLPASVLQVLSAEADRGLLHMLAVGLLPPQLEVTQALSRAPGSE